jgi:hypothetical protein
MDRTTLEKLRVLAKDAAIEGEPVWFYLEWDQDSVEPYGVLCSRSHDWNNQSSLGNCFSKRIGEYAAAASPAVVLELVELVDLAMDEASAHAIWMSAVMELLTHARSALLAFGRTPLVEDIQSVLKHDGRFIEDWKVRHLSPAPASGEAAQPPREGKGD